MKSHGFSSDSDSFSFHRGRHKRQQTRALQLCRQVQRVLSTTLAGDCGDEVLQDLLVASVEPAPNAGRLLVNVCLATLTGQVGVAEILSRLDNAAPLLRREVAASIVRKRAPELVFNVVLAPGGAL